jgi:hypothetical protein
MGGHNLHGEKKLFRVLGFYDPSFTMYSALHVRILGLANPQSSSLGGGMS